MPIAGIVHGPDCAMQAILGYPALGRDADLPNLRATFAQAFVTVGQIKSPKLRKTLFAALCNLEFSIPSLISPWAYVSPHAQLAQGTVVMHRAVVNACARIGQNCIINSGAIIEHDAVIADHCHISVGAVICGGVHIGEGSFVGAGSIVREGIHIGETCVVGCGSTIMQDLPHNTLVRENHV